MTRNNSKKNTDSSVSRRTFVAGSASLGAIGLAGCVGGKDLDFDTNPSIFTPSVVGETPYSIANARQINLGELVREMTDISAEFDAESYFVQYMHDQLPQAVINFSTPSIKALDKQVNPIATQDTKQIIRVLFGAIDRAQSDGISVRDFEKLTEEDFDTALGLRTLEVFNVEAESDQFGQIEYMAYIVKHELENAVILTTGLTLQSIEGLEVDFSEAAEEQREDVLTVLEAIEYPVDWEEDVLAQLDEDEDNSNDESSGMDASSDQESDSETNSSKS